MGNINEYEIGCGFGMASVAADVRKRATEDEEFVNESMSDVLKATTLAVLLAVPDLVDAKDIADKVGAGGKNTVVQVASPKVQKKIYDAVGKDKYNDVVLVYMIARTLMGEAVGEKSPESFDAVASVIWNRSGGDKGRFSAVILAPKQFSCWNKMTQSDKTNFVVRPHSRALTNPTAWNYCVSTAKKMVDGTFKPTGNWNHYYAHNKVKPSWAAKLKDKKVINNHTFGTL